MGQENSRCKRRTPRGLKVGDTKTIIRKLYGEPDYDNEDSTGESWTYYSDDLAYMLIAFINNKVSSITIDSSAALSGRYFYRRFITTADNFDTWILQSLVFRVKGSKRTVPLLPSELITSCLP